MRTYCVTSDGHVVQVRHLEMLFATDQWPEIDGVVEARSMDEARRLLAPVWLKSCEYRAGLSESVPGAATVLLEQLPKHAGVDRRALKLTVEYAHGDAGEQASGASVDGVVLPLVRKQREVAESEFMELEYDE